MSGPSVILLGAVLALGQSPAASVPAPAPAPVGAAPALNPAAPPSPAAEPLNAEAQAAEARRSAAIYHQIKAARVRAHARAAAADPSVRARVLARETAAWRRTIKSEHYLRTDGELDAIIARGEALDGTAARHAAATAQARARAANAAQLTVVDAAIGQGVRAALANAGGTPGSTGAPGRPFRLPPSQGRLTPGGVTNTPYATWQPQLQLGNRMR